MPHTILLALAAVGLALLAAAWITSSDLSSFASAALPENTNRNPSFEDRFSPAPPAASFAERAALPLDSPGPTVGQIRLSTVQSLFGGPRVASADLRAGLAADETPVAGSKPIVQGGIPLPRSRPAVADLEARPGSALALSGPAQTDTASRPNDRSLLQKFSDLLPGRLTLASLTPGGGLFHRAPDLAALGYDSMTAVYDITAQAVYLPNGTVLEAHSGMGSMRDDPDHVSVANYGATPPATYDLKPREKEFHGVQALRMTPADGNDIFGRSGLLTHSFMLGAKGDSNGCVSIKDYDRFLKAFNDGGFNRLVVVPSLKNGTLVSQAQATRS